MPVDEDGEYRRAGVAVAVRDGVGVGLGEGGAGVRQDVHRGVAVVERVGVAAIGVKNQAAVGEREARRGDRVALYVGAQCVLAHRPREHVAAHRVRYGVFGDARRVAHRRRGVVQDVDGERARARRTQRVRHAQGDAVQTRGEPRLGDRPVQGVGVAERAAAVARQGQRAFAGVDAHPRRGGEGRQFRKAERPVVDADGARRVAYREAAHAGRRRDGDGARHAFAGVRPRAKNPVAQAVFVNGGVPRHSRGPIHRYDAHRTTIGVPVDGDGQHRRTGIAIAVCNGVGVAVRETLAVLKCVHRRIGVIQRVGVRAVTIEQ